MTLITNNRPLLAAAAVAALALTGCSKSYEHRRLGGNDPQADQVRRLLQALREQDEEHLPAVVREQAAANLTTAQEQALQTALRELAQAESVHLVRLDAFGDQVRRATFRRTNRGRSTDEAMLLITDADGRLRWVGPNG